MAEETIRYNVEVDTAQLSEQLLRVRQDIDNAIMSSTGQGVSIGASQLDSVAVQNDNIMQNLIDRSETFGQRMLNQIQMENFAIGSPINGPQDFASKSLLENLLGSTFGFGYDPSTSPLSFGEYRRRSIYNSVLRIPIIGTEFADNRRMGDFFREISKVSIGGQFNIDEATSLAETVRNLDIDPRYRDMGFNRAEVSSIVRTMAGQGDFLSASTTEDYLKKIEDVMSSMRQVMHSFRVTGEEAVQLQGTLRDLGFQNTGDAAVGMAARGNAFGLSAREMLTAAQTGGAFAGALGVPGAVGVESFQTNLAYGTLFRRTDGIDSTIVNALGGDAGALMAASRASAGFFAGGLGLLALGDGAPITGISDLFHRQAVGDLLSVTNPTMGVLEANEKAKDFLIRAGVKDPSPIMVARAAALPAFGGIPVNVSLYSQQYANSSVKEAPTALNRETDALLNSVESKMDEMAMGGFFGNIQDVGAFYARVGRRVGSLVGGRESNWLSQLFGRTFQGQIYDDMVGVDEEFDRQGFFGYMQDGGLSRASSYNTSVEFAFDVDEYGKVVEAYGANSKRAKQLADKIINSPGYNNLLGPDNKFVLGTTGELLVSNGKTGSPLARVLANKGLTGLYIPGYVGFDDVSDQERTYANYSKLLGLYTPGDYINLTSRMREKATDILGDSQLVEEYIQSFENDAWLIAEETATVRNTDTGAQQMRINAPEFEKYKRHLDALAVSTKKFKEYRDRIGAMDTETYAQYLMGGGATGEAAQKAIIAMLGDGIPVQIKSDARLPRDKE